MLYLFALLRRTTYFHSFLIYFSSRDQLNEDIKTGQKIKNERPFTFDISPVKMCGVNIKNGHFITTSAGRLHSQIPPTWVSFP